MKNIGSFKAIAHAIEAETARQIDLIESGEKVVQETRRWNDDQGYSYAMRSKEDAQDYRYFPEPDLVPIVVSDEWLQQIRDNQPELHDEKLARYIAEFGLPEYDAQILTSEKNWQISLRRLLRFAINQRKYPTGSWEKRCVC